MTAVHEIFSIAIIIILIKNSAVVGSATGFFYNKNDTIYLITNRHVVINEKENIKPDKFLTLLHTNPNNLSQNENYEILLYENNKPRWHIHKDYETKKIDIAVVELDQGIKKFIIKAASKEILFPPNFIISPGEDVMIIGYPKGFFDNVFNLPIIRNAMISSAYGVPFRNAPYFLVDANLHKGLSGSPVFTKPKNLLADNKGNITLYTGSPIYLLGILSTSLDIQTDEEKSLGLGAVWYSSLIEEIIDSIGNSIN